MCCRFSRTCCAARMCPASGCWKSPSTTITSAASARINAQNRRLIAALEAELAAHGPQLPIYWGNRNWHPLLPDTLAQMAARRRPPGAGLLHVGLQFLLRLPAVSRKHRRGPGGSRRRRLRRSTKLRVFFNHPGFIAPWSSESQRRSTQIPADRRDAGHAGLHGPQHSAVDGRRLPTTQRSCAKRPGWLPSDWARADLRAGLSKPQRPAEQPWLEPDIGDRACEHARRRRVRDVVVVPIGFLSDHMEVLYDLDTEARARCDELGSTWSAPAPSAPIRDSCA